MNWMVLIAIVQLLEAAVFVIIAYKLSDIYQRIRKICDSADEESDNGTKKAYFSMRRAFKKSAKFTDRSRKWINEREKKSRGW